MFVFNEVWSSNIAETAWLHTSNIAENSLAPYFGNTRCVDKLVGSCLFQLLQHLVILFDDNMSNYLS